MNVDGRWCLSHDDDGANRVRIKFYLWYNLSIIVSRWPLSRDEWKFTNTNKRYAMHSDIDRQLTCEQRRKRQNIHQLKSIYGFSLVSLLLVIRSYSISILLYCWRRRWRLRRRRRWFGSTIATCWDLSKSIPMYSRFSLGIFSLLAPSWKPLSYGSFILFLSYIV